MGLMEFLDTTEEKINELEDIKIDRNYPNWYIRRNKRLKKMNRASMTHGMIVNSLKHV